MAQETSVEALKTKLSCLKKTAWAPATTPCDGPRTAAKFSGLPYLDAKEGWPACEACGKPMAFLFQLALDSLPAAVRGEFGAGLLQLFYCTDCDPWEAFTPGSLARQIVPAGPGNSLPCPVKKPDHGLEGTGTGVSVLGRVARSSRFLRYRALRAGTRPLRRGDCPRRGRKAVRLAILGAIDGISVVPDLWRIHAPCLPT